ncbi:MAG: response regulator transcription factor [Tumebacillaceae bacterium]
MSHILVVDDEAPMRKLVRIYLENAGFSVMEAENGLDAIQFMEKQLCHAVVLDLMMPGLDGWKTCSKLRAQSPDLPILMLTARADIEDKLTGFSTGADDYLTKPFDGRELVVRLQSLLLRTKNEWSPLYMEALDLVVDPEGRAVRVAGKALTLTPREFDLLLLFCRHPRRTFQRDELLDRVCGFEYQGDERTMDTHVKNIREKLRMAGIGTDPIKTVWGVGYKFEV